MLLDWLSVLAISNYFWLLASLLTSTSLTLNIFIRLLKQFNCNFPCKLCSFNSAGVAMTTSATNCTFDGLDQLTQLGYEVDWLWYDIIALPLFSTLLPTWHFCSSWRRNRLPYCRLCCVCFLLTTRKNYIYTLSWYLYTMVINCLLYTI